MTLSNWRSQIETITAGEGVTAAVTNRPITQLAQRTQHLRDRQDANDLAECLRHIEAPLDSTVLAGEVVAYNPTLEKWVKALSEIEGSGLNAAVASRSFVYGIVESKDTPSSGTIIINGVCSTIDTSVLISSSSTLTYGQMYLSMTEPGKVQSNRPALGIPVCFVDKDDNVLVRPILNELLDDHRHYKFRLYEKPAAPIILEYSVNTLEVGDPVLIKENAVDIGATATVHSIDVGNSYVTLKHYAGPIPSDWDNIITIEDTTAGSSQSATLILTDARQTIAEEYSSGHVNIASAYVSADCRGWLPAGHASFGGNAPSGALFGYNLSQHSELSAVWPIAPEGGAITTINGGIAYSEQVVIDENGVWWMDDCEDALPWVYDAAVPGWPQAPYEADTCPPTYPMEVFLWFTMMTTMTDQAVVTRLESKSGSFITVEDMDGNVASTGHLQIGAEFSLSNPDEDDPGYTVIKDITGVAMSKGPVVEKIVAESPLIATSGAGEPTGQGTVTLSMADITGVRSGVPDLYYNDNTRLDNYQNITYMAFPTGVVSGVRGRMSVPLTLSGTYDVKLVLQLMSTHGSGSSYDLPTLSVTGRKVSYQEDGDDPINVPGSGSEITSIPDITFAGSNMIGYQYLGKDIDFTAYLDLEPGDTFYFTIERDGVLDTYPSDVGIISLQFVLTKN